MDDCKMFAEILKMHRREQKLSQQELADRLGISRTYLSRIECRKATNLSYALGVRILNLLKPHGAIEVILPRRVWVDGSIALEVAWLNSEGIVTEGTCAGPPPTAMICPSSAKRARKLGYEPQYGDNRLFEIELKSIVGEE